MRCLVSRLKTNGLSADQGCFVVSLGVKCDDAGNKKQNTDR